MTPMTIPVTDLAPGDQWDKHMLHRLLDGELYPHGLDITRHPSGMVRNDGYILIVPGRYYATDLGYADINDHLAYAQWVLAFRTSDEEDLFDIKRIDHPNIKWWVQSPRVGKDYGDVRFWPVGYPPHFKYHSDATPAPEPPRKMLDVFVSAQDTHQRRHQMFKELNELERGHNFIHATTGFAQGLPHSKYAAMMATAKVAPCPSGPACPDTFRVWEALEAHAIPIVDDEEWWDMLFGAEKPPYVHPGQWTEMVELLLSRWTVYGPKDTAWWMQQKRRYAHWLREDIECLTSRS